MYIYKAVYNVDDDNGNLPHGTDLDNDESHYVNMKSDVRSKYNQKCEKL